mmetsp:Transcript_20373/g.34493  ORF Transcript_20373/g.34493 Transcript_20373/m.34493 type:complete len:93 (-) Transcript_20373:529-807(-)
MPEYYVQRQQQRQRQRRAGFLILEVLSSSAVELAWGVDGSSLVVGENFAQNTGRMRSRSASPSQTLGRGFGTRPRGAIFRRGNGLIRIDAEY